MHLGRKDAEREQDPRVQDPCNHLHPRFVDSSIASTAVLGRVLAVHRGQLTSPVITEPCSCCMAFLRPRRSLSFMKIASSCHVQQQAVVSGISCSFCEHNLRLDYHAKFKRALYSRPGWLDSPALPYTLYIINIRIPGRCCCSFLGYCENIYSNHII